MRSRHGPIAARTLEQPQVAFHLLGCVPLEQCWQLQQRLIDEALLHEVPRATVLICEHPRIVTIGRHGSRGHVQFTDEQLRRRQLEVRYLSRGGGCVLHQPGQLAVYPIVPLGAFGWSVGGYLQQLGLGLIRAFAELQLKPMTLPGRASLWGRSGLLAKVAVSVRSGVSCYGAYINVNLPMSDYAFIQSVADVRLPDGYKPTMGCLLAERRHLSRMTRVRAALVEQLAAVFSSQPYHIQSGHPYLIAGGTRKREFRARAS